MSMVLNQQRPFVRRAYLAQAFARLVLDRRMELDLTAAECAELAGMELSEWFALESGWIPTERRQLRVIAEVLGIAMPVISITAGIAAANQRHYAA